MALTKSSLTHFVTNVENPITIVLEIACKFTIHIKYCNTALNRFFTKTKMTGRPIVEEAVTGSCTFRPFVHDQTNVGACNASGNRSATRQ